MLAAATAQSDSVVPRKFDLGDELPGEFKDLLLHLLEAHNENWGADWYKDHLKYLFNQAMDFGPDPETRFRMTQFLADEASHGWMFYTVTQDMGIDTKNWGVKVNIFNDILESWPDYVMFNTLGDLAGAFQATQFTGSSYLPLARVGAKVERDEWGHARMGELHLQNLCATPEGKKQAQEYLNKWWPLSLDMFGRSDSTRNERYRFWGLKQETNGALREKFRIVATDLLLKAGLEVPDPLVGRKYL